MWACNACAFDYLLRHQESESLQYEFVLCLGINSFESNNCFFSLNEHKEVCIVSLPAFPSSL